MKLTQQSILEAVLESMGDGVVVADADGKFQHFNPRAEELLGLGSSDLPPEQWSSHYSIFQPDGVTPFPSNELPLVRALRGESVDNVELFVHRARSGTGVFLNVSGRPIKDHDGQIYGGVVVFHDVTKRKRAEETIRTSEQRFRTMAEAMPTTVAIYQGTGHAYVNAAAAEMLGYSREELLHLSFLHYVHPDFQELVKARSLARQRGEAVSPRYEIKLVHKDGHSLWVDFAAAVIEYEGKPAVLGVASDITQRKDLEAAQEKAVAAAEAASRAKSSFLANMSHEIRTPMNAVIGMTELLLGTVLSAVQREYLGIVKDSAESLLALINDILDFSKIEAGKLELDDASFQIREVLGDTMKGLALRASGKEVEIACHIHPNVPTNLRGDALRLRQVISNLVGNAIKFTQRGEVILDVVEESSSADESRLQFTVRDTGIGIPQEKQRAIFDAFAQADSSTTRRFGGTGLGLAIAARIVTLMQGRLWVESEVGKGSKFHFTGRFRRSTEAPVRAEHMPESLEGLRILVVDDNETNQLILREMLANWKMRPTTVSDAEAALRELHRAREAGRPQQVVLTDVHMPGMDGFQLTERIKAAPNLDGTVILMLTSGDGPGDVERCEKVGGSAHLMKPVKQSELFDAIVAAVGIAPLVEQTPIDTSPAIAGMRRLRILLAEDSYANQRLAVGVLTKWGHEVTLACNGQEALDALEKASFDLVLMDVQMPEMDGYQATAVIRQREAQTGSHLPIVAMTAHAMKGDREECLAAGMDGYVAKPIRRTELQHVIDEVLGANSMSRPSTDKSTDHVILNPHHWQRALETTEGDQALLHHVLCAFTDECPQLLQQIDAAIHASDARKLQQVAHTLKGNLQIFGETRARELVERLEESGKCGRFEEARELIQTLKSEADTILAEISRHAWVLP
jgi:two-component system, sensor histidine kinase and response regulator